MSDHVLTSNGMGYFWCSCNPRAHVLWSLNEHLSEIVSESATRLELLRLVVAYDNANQSGLPLPLLAGIRDALAMPA